MNKAICQGDIRLINMLISAGSDVNKGMVYRYYDGCVKEYSLISLALENNNLVVIDLLKNNSSNLNEVEIIKKPDGSIVKYNA